MGNISGGGIALIIIFAALAVVGWVLYGVAPGLIHCHKRFCCPMPNQTGGDCKSCETGYAGPGCLECAPGYELRPQERRRGFLRNPAPLPVPDRCVKICPLPGQSGSKCDTCLPGYTTNQGSRDPCSDCQNGFAHDGPPPMEGEPDTRPCVEGGGIEPPPGLP